MKINKTLIVRGSLFICLLLVSNIMNAQQIEVNINLPETVDPEKIPEDISLYQAVPVMRVTFKVTEEGYELVASQKVMGAPSTAIIKGRPLRVTAYDKQNRPIRMVTLPDPLEARTTGTDQPGLDRLNQASITLFFEKPEELVRVEVELFENRERVYRENFEM